MLAVLVVTGATPAHAATASLEFFEGGCAAGRVGLRVHGTTEQEYYHRIIKIDIWGDDEWFDDHRTGPYTLEDSAPFPLPPGFGYEKLLCLTVRQLNEDNGTDEIYASVEVYRADWSQHTESARTNVISHNF
jgi:hypothetical protein